MSLINVFLMTQSGVTAQIVGGDDAAEFSLYGLKIVCSIFFSGIGLFRPPIDQFDFEFIESDQREGAPQHPKNVPNTLAENDPKLSVIWP